MSLAALNADSVCIFSTAFGMTSAANSFAGNLHPIIPVLEGSTLSAPPDRFSTSATALQTYSAFATPSPPAQTFDILLLITMVWIAFPDDKRERPTLIGAPGNFFLILFDGIIYKKSLLNNIHQKEKRKRKQIKKMNISYHILSKCSSPIISWSISQMNQCRFNW